MEEEKKEEVKVEEQTTTVKTLEEKDENYLKLKKSNNRKKALIVILLFTLVLAGILIFLLLCQKDKEEPKKPENNQQEEKTQEDKNYKIIKKGNKINFELREYSNGEDKSPTSKLYVNDKLIGPNIIEDINGLSDVYELDDILVVINSFSVDYIHYLNSNGEKIGSFSSTSGDLFFKEIKGNDIYATSYISNGIVQYYLAVCEYSDDEIVMSEKKMSYLGNNRLSDVTTVSTKTKAEYAKEKGIDCSKTVQ